MHKLVHYQGETDPRKLPLVVAPYDDAEALDRLADGAAVITYEFENVPVDAAARIGAVPGHRALEEGQDRLREKELFRSLGIPTARTYHP